MNCHVRFRFHATRRRWGLRRSSSTLHTESFVCCLAVISAQCIYRTDPSIGNRSNWRQQLFQRQHSSKQRGAESRPGLLVLATEDRCKFCLNHPWRPGPRECKLLSELVSAGLGQLAMMWPAPIHAALINLRGTNSTAMAGQSVAKVEEPCLACISIIWLWAKKKTPRDHRF